MLKDQVVLGTRIDRARALNDLVRKHLWMSELYAAAAAGPRSTTNRIVEFSSFAILGETLRQRDLLAAAGAV